MAENKIKFGIKSVAYAVATLATNGSATYSTPVSLPGAVSLSMDPQGENTPFYADNIVYYMGVGNSGYEGDLELAVVPESFKKDCLGYILDSKGLLVEDVNAEATHFALLFQFEGDQKATRHVLYNCTATRPSVASATKEESVEPQTESITITATSIYIPALSKDVSKVSTGSSTDSTTYGSFFTAVYQPTAST